MFKVTFADRVYFTCDTLAKAEEEAYALSKSHRRWMEPENCWVTIRDVKDVVLRRVNYWVEKHRGDVGDGGAFAGRLEDEDGGSFGDGNNE